MRHPSSWDRSLRLQTAIVVGAAMVAVIAVATLGALLGSERAPLLGAAGMTVLGAVLVAAAARSPRAFAVEDGVIRIERRLRSTALPLSEVRAAAVLPGPLGRPVRLRGTSGLFAHQGTFWTRPLGTFQLVATRTRDLAVLDTARGRVVLSPDDPAAFVAEVLRSAPAAVPLTALAEGRAPFPRRTIVAFAAAFAILAALAAALLLGAWGRGARAVVVTAGAVRIERRWLGPVEIPLGEVRDARLLTPAQQHALAREPGPWNAIGIGVGRFRSDELGALDLYAWRSCPPWVLLETSRGRVVVTPREPWRLLEALGRWPPPAAPAAAVAPAR